MAITSTPGPVSGQTTLPEIITTEQTVGDTGVRTPAPTGETESGRGQSDRGLSGKASAGRGPAVRVALSEEAEALLASRDAPGKSANSPAQLARYLQASVSEAVGEFKNFGQFVSSIARGEFSLATPNDAEGTEVVDGEGGLVSPENVIATGGEEPLEGGELQVQPPEEGGGEESQAAGDEGVVASGPSLVAPELLVSDTPVLPGLETEALAVEESLLEELLEASATPSTDS